MTIHEKLAAERFKQLVAIQKRCQRQMAMLQRLEWVMIRLTDSGEHVGHCPACMRRETEGHTADCELAALLRENEP